MRQYETNKYLFRICLNNVVLHTYGIMHSLIVFKEV